MPDPDSEVICMVNSGTDARERKKENRRMMKQIARDQAQKRKEAWWQDFCSMALDVSLYVTAGFLCMVGMANDLISPMIALPVCLAAVVCTAVRLDRFARR